MENNECNYMDNTIEYLSEYYEISEAKKNLLNNEIKSINQKINELKRILESMDKKDNNYEFFSPNTKDKKYNGKTENEIKKELDELHNQNVENEGNIKKIDSKLNNIKKIIEIFNKNKLTKDEKDDNLEYIDIFNKESERIKILETQEIERKRIARDLHDSTIQNLTNIVHKTELCFKFIDIDAIRAKLELQIMIETIRSTINDMRSIIYNLRPMSLDDLGLIVSVDRYINQIKINEDIKINFNVENEEIELKPIVNLTLFRIIQEACNNILKHAKAGSINITLSYNADNINLKIVDDGIGFNTSDTKSDNTYTGFGLSMMKERVYLLSGNIKIKSEKKKGTSIFVEVPI